MKEFNSSGELIIQDATITEPGSPVNKAYVDSLVPIGSFAGTGSPEDKVAAPVGSIYVDSAATNGAVRWVKASGTGATGWRNDYGDITAALEAKADPEYVEDSLASLSPKLLSEASTNDLSFAVVDKDNRRTWLEVAPDGGPTEYALSKIGNTGAPADIPDFPTSDWAHWGDSNTDDRANKTGNWTNLLAGMTGANHYNGGYWGQGAENIAARQGGAPSLITLAGNQTNASGATDIVEATNLVVADNIDYYTVAGSLAGVPGTITPHAGGVHTFTPTTPGVYDIPPRSVFIPDTDHLRDRHVTIWMGRNDRWEPRAAQRITWATRHMVDYLTPRVKRVLVLQLVPGVEGLEHPQIKAINDMLQQEFPSQFVPIAEWMMTDEAATLAGIAYTEQDLTDIAEGRIPSSFRRDNAHFNEVGCIPIAHFLHREIQERGWL